MNGKAERPNLHPLFDDILEKTGYVALYQESLMAMCVRVKFTLAEANEIREIVSKKRLDEMPKWKERVFDKEKEGIDPKALQVLWDLLIASASYSFNACLLPSTRVNLENDGSVAMSDIIVGDRVEILELGSGRKYAPVKEIVESETEVFEVVFEDGKVLQCSETHKLLCEDLIMRPLKTIIEKNLKIMTE